jgi:hypothetical protein
MKLELAIIAATYGFYMAFEQGQYEASWRVHLFAILVPILILKFSKDLDVKARMFIMTILAWHVIDVLTHAIDDGFKNNLETQECIHIASISNADLTEKKSLAVSSIVKGSTLNSSQPQTEEPKPLQEYISALPSTDAP